MFCFSRSKIDGLHLFYHYDASDNLIIGDGNMEWEVAASIGNGANDAKAGALVEEIMTDDQCRTTPHLLVAGLRIKG